MDRRRHSLNHAQSQVDSFLMLWPCKLGIVFHSFQPIGNALLDAGRALTFEPSPG